jgi:hypothetical protein
MMHDLTARIKNLACFLAGCLIMFVLVVLQRRITATFGLKLVDWKDIATIAGIVIALLAYVTNSYIQFRNAQIENLERYFRAHERLFEPDGFIAANLKTFEDNTYKRDLNNADMEKRFNFLLGGLEKIAYLTTYAAVPATVQVYLFGWFAQKIQPNLNRNERESVFWELAVHYLDELKKAADDYAKLPTEKREKYLRKNALVYKKYS